MTKDKKVLYILSSIIFALLLIATFVDVGSSKILTAILLLPIAPIVCIMIKKRSSLSINKREVLLLTTVVASLYAILMHMSGLLLGYYKNPYFVTSQMLIKVIVPLIVIIIASEIIRYVLLSQNNKTVSVISFLICILIEILMFASLPEIRSFNKFMDLVGMTLFPAISANILYHYISKSYGALPNIAFRLITTLYIYFTPTSPSMPSALSACIKIIFPILMFAFISSLYAKRKKRAVKKGGKIKLTAMILTVVILVSSAMLISCKFRFGALVIATESMTGEINKGDMIIYERYDGQSIENGQVIVFTQNKTQIVHRVVKIENIGGEIRYYTKGDANEDLDTGYRLKSDIVGLTDFKLAYIGYPTLWLREMLNT